MGGDAAEYFAYLVRLAESETGVLGLALTGSRSAGFQDAQSDYDCALFVEDGAEEAFRSSHQDTPHGIDLGIHTRQSFAQHAEWGSDMAWDRYAWFIADFVVDRTGGDLAAAAREKGRVPEEFVKGHIDASLDWYLNQVARSARCLERGDSVGGHLEACESVRPFLQAAFAVHSRRIVPYYKYLSWEISQRPLHLFEFAPGELVDAVLQVVAKGSLRDQAKLLGLAESVFPQVGHAGRFEEWETQTWWSRYFSDAAT